MAGITAVGVAGQSATAGAASVSALAKGTSAVATAKVLASGSLVGLAGGLLGAIGGIAGAWIGSWLPAQLAPTETERQLLLERARPMMAVGVFFTIALLGLTLLQVFLPLHWMAFLFGLLGLTMPFVGWNVIHSIKTQMLVRKLRNELSPEEDPNQSNLAKRQQQNSKQGSRKFRGRRYTSSLTLFGVPLVDIQVSDPVVTPSSSSSMPEPRVACGWIAIGDVAKGLLIAIGGRAFGTIACGGMTFGLISVGGLSLGLVSLGGLALGVFAFGGAAIGYDACGGGAIGWHSATGGGAVAYHVAAGGGAIAKNFAVGGGAIAAEVNTELANQVVANETYFELIQKRWVATSVVIASIVLPFLLMPVLYTKKAGDEDEKSKALK